MYPIIGFLYRYTYIYILKCDLLYQKNISLFYFKMYRNMCVSLI